MLLNDKSGKTHKVDDKIYLNAEEDAYKALVDVIVEFAKNKDIWDYDFFGQMNVSLWERDFLSSIHKQLQYKDKLSEKQMAIIERIAKKQKLHAIYENGFIMFLLGEQVIHKATAPELSL